jgi:hypothetical protein
MTPPGKRVQTINPPGSEVGPGTTATWGKAITDEVDNAMASHLPNTLSISSTIFLSSTYLLLIATLYIHLPILLLLSHQQAPMHQHLERTLFSAYCSY